MRLIGLAVILTVSLTLAPFAAKAHEAGKPPRIGWLTSSVVHTQNVEAFRDGMRALGHPDITLEVRAAAGQMDRLLTLAAELVGRNVQVIVTDGGPAAVAAKQATATIPIVIGATAADLVQLRLVASLARPGGNVTGFTISTGPELYGKRLELLREALPSLNRVAILWNPRNEAARASLEAVDTAAKRLGLHVGVVEGRDVQGIDRAFGSVARSRASAILTVADAFLWSQRAHIVSAAARNRLPGIYPEVGRQPLRPPGPAADQVRAGHQPQDREGPRPDDAAVAPAAGGSGDRVTVQAFYDRLAPLYHLVYEDWQASVGRQGEMLASLIAEHWGPGAHTVLDAALGIGTQALGLLANGFRVTGSDISVGAVARARREAAVRRLPLVSLVADFRALPVRSSSFDVVLVCDNSLPHLDTVEDIRTALAECFRCVRPGGGCLISMRDYGTPPPFGTVEERPYGDRHWAGRRYHLRQVWTWHGPRYDFSLEISDADDDARITVLESSYLAIPVDRVAGLMQAVGFATVRRVDGRFFQPVLVGTRPGQPLLLRADQVIE